MMKRRVQPGAEIRSRFGAMIRRFRMARQLTLKELSERATIQIGGRGLSIAYISEIERGHKAPPRQPVLRVLADVLGVPRVKLEMAAQGWVVMDVVELLDLYPDYQAITKAVRQGRASPQEEVEAMMRASQRFGAKGMTKKQVIIEIDQEGRDMVLFAYRTRGA